ncbi:MAG: nuclear transport factor 2 family protein [Verrucomicrobiota bacterium]|nr:nuclear transport factor 2 family protein [Verrucomicrobiota bacterium]
MKNVLLFGLFLTTLLPAAAQSPTPTPVPAQADAIAVVRAHVEAFNRHDVDALVERVSVDFVWYNVESDATGVEVKGRDALRASLTSYFKSTPSVRSETEGMMQTGPFVSFRERAFWTSAKGERSQSSLAVYEVHDGLITRAWYYPAAK